MKNFINLFYIYQVNFQVVLLLVYGQPSQDAEIMEDFADE
jgi:hypothetical protein